MTGMTREYVDRIKENIQVGDTIRYLDNYSTDCLHPQSDKPREAKVLKKYPKFALTDKGSVQYGLIAAYIFRIENRKGADDE